MFGNGLVEAVLAYSVLKKKEVVFQYHEFDKYVSNLKTFGITRKQVIKMEKNRTKKLNLRLL